MDVFIEQFSPFTMPVSPLRAQAESPPQTKGGPDAANQRLRDELERANQKIRELEMIASKQVVVVPVTHPVTPPPKTAATPPSITPTPSSATPPQSSPSSTTPSPPVTKPVPPVAKTHPPQQPAQVEHVAPKAAAAVPANGGRQPGQQEDDAIVTPVGNKATCHSNSVPRLTLF